MGVVHEERRETKTSPRNHGHRRRWRGRTTTVVLLYLGSRNSNAGLTHRHAPNQTMDTLSLSLRHIPDS